MPKKITLDENKPWQHGFSLEYLKGLETHWSDYNSKVQSPFAAFKKNHIAAALHDEELLIYRSNGEPYAGCVISKAKVRSNITMFFDITIGAKEPGDLVIEKLMCKPGNEEKFAHILSDLNASAWAYVLEEDNQQRQIILAAGFVRVGVKINTHSDIIGIYFKDVGPTKLELAMGEYDPRRHPKVFPYENIALENLNITKSKWFKLGLKQTIKDLDKLELKFTDHYSNYNKDHAWGALSLRGYSADPLFITKPAEMNDKWLSAHANEHFEIQNTPLAEAFPAAMLLGEIFRGEGQIHRIRLMRLQPGGGELERHTDQVDKETGISDGKFMRIHIPLKTNPDVIFTLWEVNGKPKARHFPVGSAFYLDTRKPHTAVNFGKEERIHLVMDVEASDHLRNMLDFKA